MHMGITDNFKSLMARLYLYAIICLRKAYDISEILNLRENTLENVQAHSNILDGQMSSKIHENFFNYKCCSAKITFSCMFYISNSNIHIHHFHSN